MSQSQEISWTVCSCTFISHTTKRILATRSASSSGHEYLLKYGTSFQEVCGKAKNVKTKTMCSTENNAELQTTCKWRIIDSVETAVSGQTSRETRANKAAKKCGMWPLSESDVSVRLNLLPFSPSSSVWSEPNPGAEDQAPPVLGGPGGMWDLERGLLSGRSLVRLVDGIRDRLGGRLASWFRVGLPYYLNAKLVHSGSLVHSGFLKGRRCFQCDMT